MSRAPEARALLGQAGLVADTKAAELQLPEADEQRCARWPIDAGSPGQPHHLQRLLLHPWPVPAQGPTPAKGQLGTFRSRAPREPRAVLTEFGLVVPDAVGIKSGSQRPDPLVRRRNARPDGLPRPNSSLGHPGAVMGARRRCQGSERRRKVPGAFFVVTEMMGSTDNLPGGSRLRQRSERPRTLLALPDGFRMDERC
uniref:hypothetical protein n=1 Tax=Rhizobium sp. F40D2 TaxID=3453141 RepID=UPI003F21EA0F